MLRVNIAQGYYQCYLCYNFGMISEVESYDKRLRTMTKVFAYIFNTLIINVSESVGGQAFSKSQINPRSDNS